MKIRARIISYLVAVAFSLFFVCNASAQKTKTKSTTISNKEKDSRSRNAPMKQGGSKKRGAKPYWMIGIGGNVVDDDGSPFKYLFNAMPRWNVRPYPTRLTVERSLNNSFSIEGAFNFNTYKGFKIINNEVGKAGIFLSLDMNFKNSINKMLGKDGRFDPYFVYGAGATFRSVRSLPIGGNINVGLGSNFWITRAFGINIQSVAKFGMSPTRFYKTSQNYLQHSLSFVIKLQKGGKNPFIRPRYKWVHRKNLSQERNW